MINLPSTADWLHIAGNDIREEIGLDDDEEFSSFKFKKFEVRSKQGKWEKQNAALQRKLVREFNSWSKRTRDAMKGKLEAGATAAELERTMLRSIPALEKTMNQTLKVSIEALAKNKSGVIENTIRERVAESVKSVHESMIPGIQKGISSGLLAGGTDLKLIFDSVAYRPASFAGIHWVALFDIQKGLGLAREIERLKAKLPLEQIRWKLDPNAAHCSDSPDHFGCVGLAKVYSNWGSLPTVPAGKVTCRGNCRCIIEVKIGKRWVRGVPEVVV